MKCILRAPEQNVEVSFWGRFDDVRYIVFCTWHAIHPTPEVSVLKYAVLVMFC